MAQLVMGWEEREGGHVLGEWSLEQRTLEPSRGKLVGSTGHSHHRMLGLMFGIAGFHAAENGGKQIPPALDTKAS